MMDLLFLLFPLMCLYLVFLFVLVFSLLSLMLFRALGLEKVVEFVCVFLHTSNLQAGFNYRRFLGA